MRCLKQNYLTILRHLLVVLLLAGEAASRGPKGPPIEDQLTPEYITKRIGGELLSVLIVLGVLALVAAIGVCLCYMRVLWLRRHDNTVLCYLCQSRAKKSDWESHRKKCAMRKLEVVKKMPQHPTEKCPKCNEFLRLWPKQGELIWNRWERRKELRVFCADGHNFINDGQNRYDFDYPTLHCAKLTLSLKMTGAIFAKMSNFI